MSEIEDLNRLENTMRREWRAWYEKCAALEAEIDRLKEKLHDELSQLEIATDLGNKRWLALNDIYKDGEKHNVDWCKRKAQEGLGIK